MSSKRKPGTDVYVISYADEVLGARTDFIRALKITDRLNDWVVEIEHRRSGRPRQWIYRPYDVTAVDLR